MTYKEGQLKQEVKCFSILVFSTRNQESWSTVCSATNATNQFQPFSQGF